VRGDETLSVRGSRLGAGRAAGARQEVIRSAA
jgi:hypothetical protein